MNTVYCLDCDRKIQVNGKHAVGDEVRCPSCGSDFEIVDVNPLAIEWMYDYDEYDDEDDDDDDEYDQYDATSDELEEEAYSTRTQRVGNQSWSYEPA